MSKITSEFKNTIGAINNNIENSIQPAGQALTDTVKKGVSIIGAIESYKLNIDRPVAHGAVKLINARLDNYKKAVSSLQPIDFDLIWPEEKGETIQPIIEKEEAAASELE